MRVKIKLTREISEKILELSKGKNLEKILIEIIKEGVKEKLKKRS